MSNEIDLFESSSEENEILKLPNRKELLEIVETIEAKKGTGKHTTLIDLLYGTSIDSMFFVAFGRRLMSLERCEETYIELGKLVFPKENEAATWEEKLDQLYKGSFQSFSVVVSESKHIADKF